MSRKSKEELEDAFQEKLRKEWGRDDIFVMWHTHYRTAPAYLRAHDPCTCTHAVDIELANQVRGNLQLLLFRPLREYLKKRWHFYIFKDFNTNHVQCEISDVTRVDVIGL